MIQTHRPVTEWRCFNCSLCLPWQTERGTPDNNCPRCHTNNWTQSPWVVKGLFTDAEVRRYWDDARNVWPGPESSEIPGGEQ